MRKCCKQSFISRYKSRTNDTPGRLGLIVKCQHEIILHILKITHPIRPILMQF